MRAGKAKGGEISHKGVFFRCLNRLTGNGHEGFLGGEGVAKPLTYPALTGDKRDLLG